MDENQKLGEEQLDNVSGGKFSGVFKCQFIPAKPYDTKWINGELWARCGSSGLACNTGLTHCACHGKDYQCVDRYHIMTRPEGIPGEIISPAPLVEGNHNKNDKIIIYNP